MRHKKPAPQKRDFIFTNDQIKAPKIMVIDEDGNNLGTMPRAQAFALREEHGLDLVQMNYDRDQMLATAKLTDYGKYKYLKQKEEKEKKKKQSSKEMKEIKVSYAIADADFERQVWRAREFLGAGHPVKASIRLRGRENIFADKAQDKIYKIMDDLTDISKPNDTRPKQEARGFSIILFPKKNG